MIRIGIVSLGFMGMIHFLAARRLGGGRVTAICSRDARKRAGDWTGIRGNFGPPGAQVDLTGVKTFDSFEALLADPDIDVIDICTPTVQHAAMAIAALHAGKEVLVEKPIALAVADADRMLAAARAANRRLLVGHVLPFFPEFALVADAVRTNLYGPLLAAQFQRVIARPDWSTAIADVAQTGGPAIDLHIHDTHFVRMLCGMPEAVFATGCIEHDAIVHINAQYRFGPGGPSIACASGALCQRGRPFMHGYEIYFERGTLVHQSGVLPPTLYSADGGAERPTLPGSGDPVECFAAELQAAVDGISAGRNPRDLDGQLARDALALCHLECESVRSGRIVKVSGKSSSA
jgi:predicted dehydrogenase